MNKCYLYKLPNELLIHLFTPMPTPELLPLTVLSHRIYTIVLRILHNRLVIASELDSHSVLLECFHPSAKLTEPPYFCSYNGTEGLTLYDGFAEDNEDLWKRLGNMRNTYSRFRPYRRKLEAGGRRVKGLPGDVPGSRTFAGTTRDGYDGDAVKQILSLDGHELFTQLVAQTNLVKIGPRNGLFTCFVGIEEGVVRVWRHWLRDMAARGSDTNPKSNKIAEEASSSTTKAPAEEVVQETDRKDLDSESILWVSANRNTGIHLKVRERNLRRDVPILVRVDDEATPVSYEIEYEELLIRTSHLLLMLEKSLVQEDNASGKAVVFGSFG